MKIRILLLSTLLFILPVFPSKAEESYDDTSVYRIIDLNGNQLTSHMGRIYVDDEYITSDNQLYIVVQVDDQNCQAIAAHVGEEPPVDASKAQEVFAHADENETEKKLICMYSTHSDESYIPNDGEASLLEDAGIYDVNKALKKELEALGIEVILDETSHLPHDAKAYSRSRRTAEELLKKSPDALLDIHRDGIPDEGEYETEVNGEETSKVRLLVGRSNPNSDANREFAKKIKAVADEKYDRLIKDIFIGKGNYNQELYPQSILLEFGTHTLDKDLAISSTPLMADVLSTVLYGDSESAAPSSEDDADENQSGVSGVIWLFIAVVAGGLIYALLSTGTLKNLGEKLRRGANELTGGALGKKKEGR